MTCAHCNCSDRAFNLINLVRLMYGKILLLHKQGPVEQAWGYSHDPNFTVTVSTYNVSYKILSENFASFTDIIINFICDWILENQPKCHTWPIALSWPS